MTNAAANCVANGAGFALSRDESGRLVYRGDDGTEHTGVVPVRAFPITAPDGGVSLVRGDGRELVWIADLGDVPQPMRAMLEGELASREFVPEILRLRAVSGFVTPCTWHVATDRGDTQFVLRGEEAIRHLSRNTLLIGDQHGVHYLIRDVDALDAASRRMLDRFM